MRKLIVIAAFLVIMAASQVGWAKKVHVIEIDGVISPATKDFVEESIQKARSDGSEALIIQLDTPGGLLSSTKEIVQSFLDSQIPIVVYVYPAGASATSAGMMIAIAAHVAVMSPGTNIGAAHPVMISSEGEYKSIPKEDIMMEKATNDTVGWVKSICDVRGRNAEWAEKAVTESQSLPAKEAVEQKVVDAIAKDMDDLVNNVLPGIKPVALQTGDTTSIDTKDAEIVKIEMTIPQILQHAINNPNFIYILMLVGFLGVAIEFKSPGLIFPGVIGVACILVALVAPSLPINYAGFLLITVGVGLLVAEVFITSYGLLSVSGVAALVFGSLMLFDKPEVPDMDPFLVPDLAPAWPLVGAVVLFTAAVILVFGTAIIRVHRSKVATGKEGMIGESGKATRDVGPEGGKIYALSAFWNAVSDESISKGEKVYITGVDGLVVKVSRKPPGDGPSS